MSDNPYQTPSPDQRPTSETPSEFSRRLENVHPTLFSVYCIAAAFGTYFCMYAFRKPFTAATFEDAQWLGIGFKTILVSAQVTGYTISKFIGIKVVSEMPAKYRTIAILGLIAIAELALLLFAVTPVPWNFIWLFVNGLPLGMVFGLVLGFLEGRKVSEALTAGLCASFILASGFVKSVGRSLILDYGINEYWMPFVTGLIFVVPLLVCVGLLGQIPPPSEDDESRRSKRSTMDHSDRSALFRRHWFGLMGLLFIYTLLTIVRSLRDDFSVEIWQDLGVDDEPSVFARSEFWVMLGVIAVNGMAVLIRNNRFALLTSLTCIGGGFIMILGTLLAHQADLLSPMGFMVLLGLGMYLPYVAFHTTVFERLIAAFRETGTVAYLMYLADAFGYLGYVGVMIFRNYASDELSYLNLLVWVAATIGIFSFVISCFIGVYYYQVTPRDTLDSQVREGSQNDE